MRCPFETGDEVTWADSVPREWLFIWTPGPMTVVSFWWHNGRPSKFARMFGITPRAPAWMVTVEYDPDSTDYYDPPLSIILGKPLLRMDIHEKWLKLN